MNIKWLGHSCFLLTSADGTRILTDPCDPDTGYAIEPVEADAVTSSHDHHDHNYFAIAPNARRITAAGHYDVNGVSIDGFDTFHDSQRGAIRGGNVVFVITMDGLRVAHAGDLGHIPDEATLAAIGRVDVLLIPIGGQYTLDYKGALELSAMLHPSIVIPMHYQTERLRFPLDELKPFLDNARGCAVHIMRQSEASIDRDSLGKERIIVLEYEK